jgi:hypothetical protein
MNLCKHIHVFNINKYHIFIQKLYHIEKASDFYSEDVQYSIFSQESINIILSSASRVPKKILI